MVSNNSKNLNPRQQEAVEYKNGPILIAAGAGSGKTKTLTSRLAYLINNGANPENIIAITFTNKAAKEMADRVTLLVSELVTWKNRNTDHVTNQLSNSVPFLGTFHSLGARILKNEAGLVSRTPAYTIFDNDDSLSLLKKTMKAMDLSKEKYNPLSLHSKISQIKNELLEPEEFDHHTKNGEGASKTLSHVFYEYEKALVKNNAFDFDDLLQKIVWIFQRHPAILEKYQNKFQYILVDEYQDINTAQYQFIKLLAQKHRNLSVVGDDQQAIYSFRGADFRNFLNFQNDWPDAKIVKLEQNYRSSSTIITAASEVIKNNKFQTPKTLWTENDAGRQIKVIRAADAEQEASYVTSLISDLVTWKNQNRYKVTDQPSNQATAILYRTNSQSRAIEQSLIAAQIPYKIFGGLKFYERKEIKDLVAGLRLAYNPKDTVSGERIAKNFDKKTAAHLLAELPRLGKNLNILELINYFIVNADYLEYLEKNYKNYQERTENVNEFIRFAGEFKNLDEFLERVSLLQSADAPTKQTNLNPSGYTLNPVNLMTIHLAKGLEFDQVFVIGVSEGLLPHQMSYGSLDELEEERRLMYVAMTRARKELALSFHGTPSRFLYEIPPELTQFIDMETGQSELPDEEGIYIE